jgi:hypothetical protein
VSSESKELIIDRIVRVFYLRGVGCVCELSAEDIATSQVSCPSIKKKVKVIK